MRRHGTVGRKPAKKSQQRKPTRSKRSNVARASRPASSTLADLQEQVGAVTRELAEARKQLVDALEQQTATSEVLRVISSSPGELEPVFQAMLENAVRICEAKFGTMYRYDGDMFRPTAVLNAPPTLSEFIQQRGAFQPPSGTSLHRLLRTKSVVHSADDSAEQVPS